MKWKVLLGIMLLSTFSFMFLEKTRGNGEVCYNENAELSKRELSLIDVLIKEMKAKRYDVVKDSVDYPLLVISDKQKIIINNSSEFLNKFEEIFTWPLLDKINRFNSNKARKSKEGIILGNTGITVLPFVGRNSGVIERLLITQIGEIQDEKRLSEDKKISLTNLIYFLQIKDALLKDDKEWLISQIEMPFILSEKVTGRYIMRTNKNYLLSNYELFFLTPIRTIMGNEGKTEYGNESLKESIKDKIAKCSVNDLWKNWRGVCVNNGTIWFTNDEDNCSLKCKHYKIISLNPIGYSENSILETE